MKKGDTWWCDPPCYSIYIIIPLHHNGLYICIYIYMSLSLSLSIHFLRGTCTPIEAQESDPRTSQDCHSSVPPMLCRPPSVQSAPWFARLQRRGRSRRGMGDGPPLLLLEVVEEMWKSMKVGMRKASRAKIFYDSYIHDFILGIQIPSFLGRSTFKPSSFLYVFGRVWKRFIDPTPGFTKKTCTM